VPEPQRLQRVLTSPRSSRASHRCRVERHAPTQLQQLVSSCSVLAVLARDLRHLTQLLWQGEIQAAQEYRARLE
jgi:hypothetical protein